MPFSFFQTYLRLTGYPLQQARAHLSMMEKQNAEERKTASEKQKWAIVKYHFENNEFYRNKLNGVFPSAWESIPELSKRELQLGVEHLLSKPYTVKGVYLSNTSGSTGTPFYYAKDKYSHALTWALIELRYATYGIGLNHLQARFYGIPLTGFSAFKERMKDRIMNRYRFPVFDLSAERLEQYLDVFKRKKFFYIYGYTNSIVLFCKYLIQKNIKLIDVCPTLIATLVTSEMCSAADKALIEDATGKPCIIEYGASEFGIISFQDKQGFQKISEELLWVETNDKNEVLITSLFNTAFPFIRYNIGDRCTLIYNEQQQLGIEQIMGRSDDSIVLPNGKVAAGLTMYYCSRKILESFTHLKEIYFTQTALDSFQMYYVSDVALSGSQIKIIQEAFDTYLTEGLQVAFIQTNTIRRKANGKFQLFTSLLPPIPDRV